MKTTQEKFAEILNKYIDPLELKELIENLHKGLNKPPEPRVFYINRYENTCSGGVYTSKRKADYVAKPWRKECIRAVELPEGSVVVNKARLDIAWARCEKNSVDGTRGLNFTYQNFLKNSACKYYLPVKITCVTFTAYVT